MVVKGELRIMKYLKNEIKRFMVDEAGVGVVEIVLILMVLLGLVIIFKNEIEGIMTSIFKSLKVKINNGF